VGFALRPVLSEVEGVSTPPPWGKGEEILGGHPPSPPPAAQAPHLTNCL